MSTSATGMRALRCGRDPSPLSIARGALAAAAACIALAAGCAGAVPQADAAHGIPAPLEGRSGDAARGRALVAARDPANCVLCHAIPGAEIAGDLGPPLAGVGRRLDRAQMRLRVADERRVMPETIMPSYYRSEGLHDVAPAYRGRTILDAQAVEDIVAYLTTLQ
jgi:sulfur-oxidizing protein SoxX